MCYPTFCHTWQYIWIWCCTIGQYQHFQKNCSKNKSNHNLTNVESNRKTHREYRWRSMHLFSDDMLNNFVHHKNLFNLQQNVNKGSIWINKDEIERSIDILLVQLCNCASTLLQNILWIKNTVRTKMGCS